MDMTNLQSLSIFLTERLTLAAQEIFKAVEVTVTEYHDEISRSRQENELLRSRLLEAGIELYSELQPGVSALPDGLASAAEPWGEEGADIRVKLELSATRDEPAPPSPTPWREGEARVEDALGTLTADSGAGALLHAAPFAQDVKEEPEDAGTDLRTEASSAAANRACGLEDALESYRLTPVHKALRSKLPLTSKSRVTLHKRCINYDPMGQDKELTQRRERYRMKRARGKSKLLKVGRERKTEQSTEPTACRILGDSLADVTLLDEDQSPPSRFQANLANLTEEMSENGQEPSAMFHGGPVEDDSLAGANLCVVCGRTFTSRGLLKIHLRVHSGEKPYHCHFCDKNFRQSSHLNVHVRIHTGEKPYSCPTCGKRFSDRSARNRHLKVHLESAEEIHS
ncbi:zinc finger protein 700 isoform X2 [Electrophorus electricus]|uniref:C2H2-type domain-containing protein n=1 Tax=Electrophorus electricus TaxID=8005 RepID=A0A4W4GL11_ELEEL|nr:zinc finger protein 700 isoform X2 [Electrophorus electricus]